MMIKQVAIAFMMVCCLIAGANGENILILSDEWPQMDVLAEYFEENGHAVKKVEQDALPADLSPYGAILMFIHGGFDAQPAQAVMKRTKDGARLIVLHHGISSKKKQTPGWLPFLGIHLDRNQDAKYRYVWIHDIDYHLVNLQPDHYITSHKVNYKESVDYRSSDQPSPVQKLPAIVFSNSEVFIHHQFADGREKTVLFGYRFEHPETGNVYMEDRYGWYKSADKGWIFYFQPGHTVEDVKNKDYQQILHNCLTWKP